MLVSKITENDLTVETVDSLLFKGLDDTGECGDCILVLGSFKASMYRVPVAVAVYQAGRAGKLLLSGGAERNFPEGKLTEAQHMRMTAIDLGVAEKDIILENQSQNTLENILFARKELEKLFGLDHIQRLILVTTAYHMRRSLAIARVHFPEHITIVPCPANDTNTRRDNWMNSTAGIERAKTEAMKLVRYAALEIIPDFEV